MRRDSTAEPSIRVVTGFICKKLANTSTDLMLGVLGTLRYRVTTMIPFVTVRGITGCIPLSSFGAKERSRSVSLL